MRLFLLGTLLMSFSFTAMTGEAVDERIKERLTRALESRDQSLSVTDIRNSALPNMYEVKLKNAPLLYIDERGEFFIVGDLYSMTTDSFVNLTEQRRNIDRVEHLSKVPPSELIVFSPNGKPKASISVFTDITCPFCQKFHQEVPELNRRGIEVRYFAYPREGLSSEAFLKLETAWCSQNRQDALTRSMIKKNMPHISCADSPVAKHYQLGQEVGLKGTPAIITQDGSMLPGYQSATDLIASLGLE